MKVRKRITKLAGGRVKTVWECDLGKIDGKRTVRYFPSKGDAEAHLQEAKGKLAAFGALAYGFTEVDRNRFAQAAQKLATVNATIEQAVEFFIQNHRTLKEPLSLQEALNRCLLDAELRGMSPHYVKQLKCACGSFVANREAKLVTEVTRDDLKAWIMGNGWQPKTQRVYLGDVRTLFAWCVTEGYLGKNPAAAEDGEKYAIQLSKMVDSEIEVFGPEACEKLLMTALLETEERYVNETWQQVPVYRPLIGYIAIAMFCGVRPEELKRSPRTAVDVKHGSMVVTGGRSKTARRRVIDLSENGQSWLSLWLLLCPEEMHIIPRNFVRLWKALRARAKLKPWPHDVLRHTFASMHFAKHKDRAWLQAGMGHSEGEDTLERHYRSVRTIDGRTITAALAENFWQCFPPPRYREHPEEEKGTNI